ncbi:MAG: carboxylesterase family protein [Eubacteriales bacterium]|nr:carboxylesterase family protein [Eubacteriales bacterium]
MAVYDIEKFRKRMQDLTGHNRTLTGKACSDAPAVKCHNGTFVGTETDGVRSYKGIPYAVPPVGERRWKAPEPAPEDSGVYEARYFGKSCIQTEAASERASLYMQGEDCLTLNIWTSAGEEESSGGKPVMVFIHGGSYGWGGTADPLYDGHNLVRRRRNVVLVTINYRIGLFGFIDFSKVRGGEAYRESGNLGLLDQICALSWIRRNIRGFGGDPGNVTLFGESAGASSVSLLPLIDSAKGLFRRVIAESGSIAFTYSREEAQTLTEKLLEETGASCMEELAALDEDRIRAVNGKLNDHAVFPVRDGIVLPEDLYEAYRAGRGSGVDMLIGTNADETRYWIGEMGGWVNYWCAAPVFVRSIIHGFREEDRPLAEAFLTLQKGSAVHRATEFFNELIFRVPSIAQASFHAGNGGNTYMYYWTKKSAIPHFGACHAVELAYVFGNLEETIYTGKKADKKLSDTVQDMWVRFAAAGNPGTEEYPWEKYEASGRMTMLLGDDIRMVSDPFKENRVLIEPLLVYRYNGNYDQTGMVVKYLKKAAGQTALRLVLAGTAAVSVNRLLSRRK